MFNQKLMRSGQLKDFGKISPIEVHIGRVPIESAPSQITDNGLIVIGNAACQPNPMVGERIRMQ